MEYIGPFLYIYKEYVGGVDVHDDLIGVKSLLLFFFPVRGNCCKPLNLSASRLM